MTQTAPIKALFLDVGGVLLTNGWDHNSRNLAAAQFALEPIEMEARHNLTFDTYEIGKISLDTYLNRVVFYQERSFSKSEFIEFMYAQSKGFPEMLKLIAVLKAKYSLKIAVVSNEGRELTEYRIKQFKLGDFVDFFISSCFVHLRKPDTAIFKLALDTAQVPPHQVIYIDDRSMFVQIAEEFKMHGICHKDFQSTVAKLASFGLST